MNYKLDENATTVKSEMLDECMEVLWTQIPMRTLFEYYKPTEIQGYCEACPNFNRIWSCPPFDFTAHKYLKDYDRVLLIAVKTRTFEETRRNFGDCLISISENSPYEALIAGNCYQCDACTRQSGETCVKGRRLKYSLESLGFHVGDICEHILKSPLDWNPDHPNYTTVGALLWNQSINAMDSQELHRVIQSVIGCLK